MKLKELWRKWFPIPVPPQVAVNFPELALPEPAEEAPLPKRKPRPTRGPKSRKK